MKKTILKYIGITTVIFSIFIASSAIAGVPVVNIEGEGGGGLVPWAYLTNPPEEGKILGRPTVGATYIFPQNFNVNIYHFNETITDRLELGFARTIFNTTNLLGTSGLDKGVEELVMDTIHAKLLLLKETDTLPAISVSAEYKKNRDIDTADRNSGGALTAAGYDDDKGFDYALSLTKLIKAKLPILVNVGARYTKANQTGYLGFSDDARILPEVSLAVMPESNVVVGFEYRAKPDEYRSVAGLGSFTEDDWSDFFVA